MTHNARSLCTGIHIATGERCLRFNVLASMSIRRVVRFTRDRPDSDVAASRRASTNVIGVDGCQSYHSSSPSADLYLPRTQCREDRGATLPSSPHRCSSHCLIFCSFNLFIYFSNLRYTPSRVRRFGGCERMERTKWQILFDE